MPATEEDSGGPLCVVPAGGLSPDHTRWVAARPGFFLPVRVLSRVFRGKFVAGLRELHAARRLSFHGSLTPWTAPAAFAAMLRELFRSDWVVYSKRPFSGAEHALRYLGCYTHRVAISNHRLVALEDGEVVFRWRDSAHHNKKRLMRLALDEFLRRFFLHVLPRGFVRIRHFGFLAHRRRAKLLPLCFARLAATAPSPPVSGTPKGDIPRPLWTCPQCGGPMGMVEKFTAADLRWRAPHLPGKHHDLLFDISNGFSAETPAPKLRVLSAPSAPREQSTPPTPLQTYFSLYPNSACKRPCRHSKPITSRVQTAHFKSLYRKRSGPGLSACSRSLSAGAFPIQP